MDDAALLWAWANDANTRDASFDSRPIPWPRHVAWLTATLASPATRIWMLIDPQGTPVGQVRYERVDSTSAEISLVVAPEHRRQGHAVDLLALTRAAACDELGVDCVTGWVKDANGGSRRVFERAGFRLAGRREHRGFPCHLFEWRCEDGAGPERTAEAGGERHS